MKKVTFTKVTGDILRAENLLNREIGGFDIITKTVNNAGNENKRNYKKYVVFSSSLSNNINFLNNVSIKFTYVEPTI